MPRPVGSNTVTQTRTFTYTGAQVASATNPENGMVQYTYNDARQVTRRVDAKGQETTYEYDAAGRLTTVRHYPVQWQEDTGQRVSYTYDSQSLVPGYTDNGTGRLAAVEFMAGGISGKAMRYVYKYNAAGRVTGRKMQVDRGGGYWYDIDVGYTWDNEGRVTALAHPDGSNYSYTFDAMGRLSGMSGGGTASATYGVAGQLTGLSYLGVTETRVYNDVLQMTRLTAASGGSNVVDMEYVYAAGRNNGRITQAWDHVSGEQVNYTYDSLNRLATAVTADNTNVAQWGLQFSYDGFGNANGQTVIKGSAPTGAVAVEAATNRVIGETYDANGNPVGVWQGVAARVFDVENRMVFDNDNGIRYGYDDKGKRVLRGSEVYVWGVDGKRLATYQQGAFNQDCQCVFYGWVASNVYFGGKLVKTAGTVVVTDRLGSVRWKGNGESYHYHPYGQQYAGDSTASKVDGKEKFGTYFRDADGKDYADQRYYGGAGRFLTPDPATVGTSGSKPQTLNFYLYADGDPINHADSTGLFVQEVGCGTPGTEYCLDDGTGNVQMQGGGALAYICSGAGFIPASVPSWACFVPVSVPVAVPPPPPPDPCPGIAQKIWDTISGRGMPGGKSLLRRVVEQITGDPARFDSHQVEINGLRDRLRNLRREWRKNDCDDPDDPPYGTNLWIDETAPGVLRQYAKDYQQYISDLKAIASGVAAAATIAEAAALFTALSEYIVSLGGSVELIPVFVP